MDAAFSPSTIFPYTTLFRSVFGNMGDDSATGVCFTRNPSTGAREGLRVKRSEEHTSELQSRLHIVCRLPPEKTNTPRPNNLALTPPARAAAQPPAIPPTTAP